MTIARLLELRCDFWGGAERCASRELVVPVRLGDGGARRMTNQEARDEVRPKGWSYDHGPSSCRYDLCPTHRHLRPGVDFPDWRR